MILLFLYRIGRFMALHLPIKFSYAAARFLAAIHCFIFSRERRAIAENMKVVFSRSMDDKELDGIAKSVFRNFAKYLVDFFRISVVDAEYIKNFVKVEGRQNIDEALKRGKGIIILSAHLGNWELGGYVLSKIGYTMNAVVLTHKNKKVNDFFISQRRMGNFKSIEFGASLRGCYRALKNNELLALLGDRNFSDAGLMTEFFGKKALMPKGPAVLSVRTGAAIVPVFMTRQNDDTFRMRCERPIYPEDCSDEDKAIEGAMKKYLSCIEDAVRSHPGQWYVFKYFWKDKNG
jgi:KDO2-lipid IV(A) lauroyltransferase